MRRDVTISVQIGKIPNIFKVGPNNRTKSSKLLIFRTVRLKTENLAALNLKQQRQGNYYCVKQTNDTANSSRN
jgi:hypothetical protein